ncbi:MAG: transmembrane 220 family protein, partial [Cyclobacteriaceae bacterium]
FLVFAIVQLNDPDPLLWVSLYLLMAGVSAAAFFEKLPNYLIIGLMALCLFMMTGLWSGTMQWFNSPERTLIFDDIAKMQNIYIEEAREFLGLCICLVALTYFLISGRGAQVAQ